MNRFARGRFQLGYLVLQSKLFLLQLVQMSLIGGGVKSFLLDFTLERLVAAFEFGEMALHRHAAAPVMGRTRRNHDTGSSIRKGFAQRRPIKFNEA